MSRRSARESLMGVIGGLRGGARGVHRGGNGRGVQGLAQADAGVLFTRQLQRDGLVAYHREARRAAGGCQQFVEGLIGGIEELSQGQIDLTAAAGARIAGVEA